MFYSNEDSVIYRINWSEGIGILIIAGLFEVASFIPLINIFFAIIGNLIILGFFMSHKVNLLSAKLILILILVIISELIPIVSSFVPGFIGGTLLYILISRFEDRQRHKNMPVSAVKG